jgi:hypothetical protein
MCMRHVGSKGFSAHIGDIMNDRSNTPHRAPRKILKPRRLSLLASVAGLSMAVLVAGPSGYLPLNLSNWMASARAGPFTNLMFRFAPVSVEPERAC